MNTVQLKVFEILPSGQAVVPNSFLFHESERERCNSTFDTAYNAAFARSNIARIVWT